MGLLVIAAIIGFIWVYSKISQANREQEEREARARREAEQRRLREIQEQAAAEERRKHEAYLQRRRTDPYFDMMERQKEERVKAEAERKRRAEEEAKRQAELTRRRNLAAKFKYITLGGHKAAYCFDYYPKNRFPSVTAQQEADRRAVWNFKDGSYTYGLNRLADFLDGNFTKEEMKNVVVCVIPASTQCKNDIRYKTMCAKIAEKFPVINGYKTVAGRFFAPTSWISTLWEVLSPSTQVTIRSEMDVSSSGHEINSLPSFCMISGSYVIFL